MFSSIKKWWTEKHLGKEEVSYRDQVKKDTWTRFPLPTGPTRKGKTIVKSKLGLAYYEKSFPSWIMWDSKEPQTLFINVDMVVVVFSDVLNLPRKHLLDNFRVELMLQLAEQMAVDLLEKRLPRMSEHIEIKRHYKTNKYQEGMRDKIQHKFWFDVKQVEYLNNIDVGGR